MDYRQQMQDTLTSFMAMWNSTEPISIVEKLVASNSVHSYPLLGSVSGPEGIKGAMHSWHAVFSPFRISYRMLDGPSANEITIVWKATGKFANDFGPIKAHGKWVAVPGATVFKFDSNAKIVSEQVFFDGDNLMKQFKGEIAVESYLD